jgi:hypothetical protein
MHPFALLSVLALSAVSAVAWQPAGSGLYARDAFPSEPGRDLYARDARAARLEGLPYRRRGIDEVPVLSRRWFETGAAKRTAKRLTEAISEVTELTAELERDNSQMKTEGPILYSWLNPIKKEVRLLERLVRNMRSLVVEYGPVITDGNAFIKRVENLFKGTKPKARREVAPPGQVAPASRRIAEILSKLRSLKPSLEEDIAALERTNK